MDPTAGEGARSSIAADTIRAYRETDYRVRAVPVLVLRIGVFEPRLAQLFLARGVRSGAFVTACNPGSRLTSAADNRARRLALEDLLRAQGWPFLAGEGVHPAGGWPAEASCFILGVPCDLAQDLARRFGQNAIVWCGPDAVPQLLLLR